MAKDRGGQAFPELIALTNNDGPRTERWDATNFGGMTLRDYFAAQAMVSLVPLFSTGTLQLKSGDKANEETIAESSYAFADAMLAQRQKE